MSYTFPKILPILFQLATCIKTAFTFMVKDKKLTKSKMIWKYQQL